MNCPPLPNEPSFCPICCALLMNESHKKDHIEEHRQNLFSCSICPDYIFLSSEEREIHIGTKEHILNSSRKRVHERNEARLERLKRVKTLTQGLTSIFLLSLTQNNLLPNSSLKLYYLFLSSYSMIKSNL